MALSAPEQDRSISQFKQQIQLLTRLCYLSSNNPSEELSRRRAVLSDMARLLAYLVSLLVMSGLPAAEVPLEPGNFEHIHFRRIQPTNITFNDDSIRIAVNDSSSFLLLPFDPIKTVRTVTFDWKVDGRLKKRSIEHEKSSKGDDAWIRVGLIVSGQPEYVPKAFLPRWVNLVRKTLKHPSDRMIYLVPDAKHPSGESWTSPFSTSIEMISVDSRNLDDDWKQAHHTFVQPLQVVGLWIMADGDNTNSAFNTELRRLIIE